jgi:hypothetical protein
VYFTFVKPEQVKWLNTLPQYFPLSNFMKMHYTAIKSLHAMGGWYNFNWHSTGTMLKKEEEFNKKMAFTIQATGDPCLKNRSYM